MKREQNRKRLWLMGSAWVGLSLAVILFALPRLPRLIARAPAQEAESSSGPLQVFYLASNPTPDELADAKRALAHGEIVFTRGGSLNDFDGLLGVGVHESRATQFDSVRKRAEQSESEATTAPPKPLEFKAVAARIAPNGALHAFVYYAGSAACDSEAALDAWENQQDQQDQEGQDGDNAAPNEDTPVPSAWTQVTEKTYGYCSRSKNYMQDRLQVYRLNDSDTKSDWYLAFKQSWATQPNFKGCVVFFSPCGWLSYTRAYNLYADSIPNNEPGPRFTLYEHNPKNVSGSVSFRVGGSLGEGPGFGVSWNQPEVDTADKSSLPDKFARWGDKFNFDPGFKPPDNTAKYLFETKPESIFEVPEGTDNFFLHVFDNTRWYYDQVFFPRQQWIDAGHAEPVEPPTLRVNPDLFIMTPGERRELFVLATKEGGGELKWRVTNSPAGWLVVTPSFGAGSEILTVEVKQSAQPGEFAALEFDTNPPAGAPSVGKGPLVVKVRVVAKDSLRTKVLLAGGVDQSGRILDTAEVWDPATKESTAVPNMTSARQDQTATLLPDGKILIAGGRNSSGAALNTAELFDPIEQRFAPTGNMLQARWGATATLLNNGLVLIAGGCCDIDGNALRRAEVYNPSTKKFQPTGNSMAFARFDATATLLPSGVVLIAGGSPRPGQIFSLREAEIFEPSFAAGHFFRTGDLRTARQGATGVLLKNEQVLMIGGWTAGNDPIGQTELYTPGSGAFTYTGNINPGRRYAASAPLFDGRALVVGGYNGPFTAVIYNPDTATWGLEIVMTEHREAPTATLLTNTGTELDGDVLVAGGVIAATGSSGGKLLELYHVATNSFQRVGEMTTSRIHLTATAFSATGVQTTLQ